jgi:hypothetical protein
MFKVKRRQLELNMLSILEADTKLPIEFTQEILNGKSGPKEKQMKLGC